MMAFSLVLDDPRLPTAAEFLRIEFPSDFHAELDRGVLRPRERNTVGHARVQEEWSDRSFADPADVTLPSIGVTIPHAEIFARD